MPDATTKTATQLEQELAKANANLRCNKSRMTKKKRAQVEAEIKQLRDEYLTAVTAPMRNHILKTKIKKS